MTKIDTSTAAIEALLKDVTPGPWESFSFEDTIGVTPLEPTRGDVAVCSGFSSRRGDDGQANANFIAAARELVPALLAERDALKAEVERLKAQVDEIWNEAIEEAAQMMSVGGRHTIRDRTEAIRFLKRPVKGETHE